MERSYDEALPSYAHVNVHMHMYTHMHVYMHAQMYVHAHIHIHMNEHTYMCMIQPYSWARTCAYTHMYTNVCTQMHTYHTNQKHYTYVHSMYGCTHPFSNKSCSIHS